MKSNQRGAALFVGMIFLLVLTVFSLTAMRLSTLDERMTGNYLRQLQAAELAEQVMARGMTLVAQSKVDPTVPIPSNFVANFGPGVNAGLIEEGAGESGSSYGRYEGQWAQRALSESVTGPVNGVIEKLDLSLGQGQLEQGGQLVQGGDYYRISTWGNVGDAASGRAASATLQNFFVP